MRELPRMMAAALLAAWTCTAFADPNQDQSGARPPLGNNPNPVIRGGQQPRPAQAAPQPPARPAQPAPQPPAKPADDAHRDHGQPSSGRPSYYIGGYSPYLSGFYGYDPYGYQYPYYPPLYSSYLPPLYLPAEDLFGPRAAQRILGGDNPPRPKPNANVIVDDEGSEPKRGVERGTNSQAVTRAWKLIAFGDARFARQEYSDANQRYRDASRTAPQLADAWFRQGFAMIAIGRYDLAVAAIRRGLKLNPNWAKSDFNLKELYGPDDAIKNAHRDALAEAAEANPNDADLLFLLGVHLYFDGQIDRAKKFFARAKEFAGVDADHLNAFPAK